MPAPCCSSNSAGLEEDVERVEAAIHAIVSSMARARGAARASKAERDALWAGRKGAAGATGRIAPNYYTQDVCVPRSKLPQALRAVEERRSRKRSHGRQRLSRRRR